MILRVGNYMIKDLFSSTNKQQEEKAEQGVRTCRLKEI